MMLSKFVIDFVFSLFYPLITKVKRKKWGKGYGTAEN